MSDALIASIAAILVALLGAGLSFVQTRRLQRRQARLARLNAQLEELYGPIYATLEASRIAYRRLLDKLRPGSVSLFDPGSAPPSEEELRIFRRWIETVSHPRATEAHERIISKAHLLIEDEMPECLLTFCAHKAGYDVLIQRWHDQDFTEHLSVVRHPATGCTSTWSNPSHVSRRNRAKSLRPPREKCAEGTSERLLIRHITLACPECRESIIPITA
jgi:hypothetical protein